MSDRIKHFYEFEEFRLDAENRSLWRRGELVQIFPKALEILILLVDKRGAVVSREELLETVWSDSFVEESNITYTVSLLRKSLGVKQLIQTVPKLGYRFTADVKKVAEEFSEETIVQPKADEIFLQPSNGQPAEIGLPEPPKRKHRRWVLLLVALFGVIFLTSFSWWFYSDNRKIPLAERKINTIAILPFKNLSENEQNKSLALGLTDSLINRLGSLNRFTVRPLEAVEKFQKSETDALRFGEKLMTDAVLEGTFQTVENRFRVNVRLLDVRDGAQLWAGSFDETETDIFKLQDALANQVAQSLAQGLTRQEQEILGKRYTENAEAYRAYVRGRAIFDQRGADNFERAIDEYQKAIALDPTFALAYNGFAKSFIRRAISTSGKEAEEFYAKAEKSAQKALELDPNLAEAHTALALIKRLSDWDWEAAERGFKRGAELNPNNIDARLGYAQMLAFLSRGDEATVEIEKALEIDPLSPDVHTSRMAILESRGKSAEAFALAQEYAKFNKENFLARRALATYAYQQGDDEKVIEICEQMLDKQETQKFWMLSLAAAAYHRAGNAENADERLRQLEAIVETNPKALYSLAMNYAELGRADEALAALEKCFEMREERLSWMNVEPRLANLKGDSRFQELVKKMRLDKS